MSSIWGTFANNFHTSEASAPMLFFGLGATLISQTLTDLIVALLVILIL